MSIATTAYTRTDLDRGHDIETVVVAIPPDVRLEVSHEDFERLCRENPEVRLERTAEGELIAMVPAGGDSGRRNAKLITRLVGWAEADGTGEAFDCSTGFILPNGAIRAPDATWIPHDKWNSLTPSQRRTFLPLCPDFAVELRSPSDSVPELRRKMEEYIAQGTRLAWFIDPDGGKAEVYRPGRPVEVLDRPAMLSGEDVLPGFVLDLKGILFD
ncbi:Uma2 family endonuclease [Aquisphaera insulae]|uniref:Uma2 family endonuclease n=1 Tax=Aquisphaera insulae TaxID=2712864 RepID=UPI0013EAC8F5|nr:Uma2 family endonuclease [Aquisphaera insulae]